MNPVSPEFLGALRGSHRLAVQVDLLQFGQILVPDLQVVDGTVTLDAAAATYGQCEVTIIEPGQIPTAQFGTELAIRRGIAGHRPTPELVPLGVFKITSYDLDGTTGELRLTGMDRSKFALDARLEDDLEVAAGTPVNDVIGSFIATAVPHALQALGSSAYTVPGLVYEVKTSPWEAVQQLAAAIGKQPRFDGLGTLRLVNINASTAPPVWTIDEGEAGVLVSASLAVATDDDIFNRIIAASPPNDAGTVYMAVATDTTSTAHYGGPFGRKPDWIESDLFTSNAMCADAARSRLDSILGTSRSVSFAAVPNCALVPWDVIQLRNSRLGLDTRHVIEKLIIGLTADAEMTGTTRVAL